LRILVTAAALLVGAATARSMPSLSIAYHCDDHAAPLFDACLYPSDFRARYGLNLRQVDERESYSLLDRGRSTLSLKLTGFRTDSEVLDAVLSGSAQVGILESEEVLGAVLKGLPVRIVAPLQRAEDFLEADSAVPAKDWGEFIDWVRARAKPTVVWYIGRYPMAVLGFMQALEYEHLKYATDVRGLPSNPESVKVRLVPVDDLAALAAGLSARACDAALLPEPSAARVEHQGWRRLARTDILPPGRFEDHPGTVIIATDSAIRRGGDDINRFLELMAVASHYANIRTRNTLAAVCRWLGTSPELESVALSGMGFSSRPDIAFTTGIWNWYFTLRLRNAVPPRLAGYMEEQDWLGVPYDSLLLAPALDRAGARIIR